MKGFAAAVVVVAVFAGFASAQPPATTGTPGPLQGYWKPVSVRFEDAEQMQDAVRPLITMVIDGEGCFLYFKVRDKGEERVALMTESTVRLAPGKDGPGSGDVELTFTKGPMKGHKRLGVYALANSQLRLCHGPADKPRPTAFEAPKGSGYFNEVWVLQPPK